MTTSSRQVSFAVDGSTLTGIITEPESHRGLGALLLHPHPLYGGTMDDVVTLSIERCLLRLGVATMRFNFRGAVSAPTYRGVAGAIDDALAAESVLRSQTAIERVGIVGYSFGGSVALHVAALRSPEFLCTVSASYDIAAEVGDVAERLASLQCPVLMIHGSADSVVPVEDLDRIRSFIQSGSVAPVVVEGAGHFYHHGLHNLEAAVTDFVSRLVVNDNH
ncbi:MAG: alpha/beta hydrolase [Candidatus Thorarchaeota archaeon]